MSCPLRKSVLLLEQFYALWSGETSNKCCCRWRLYSVYPLRMLTDLPRTAHIFRSVANWPPPPDMAQDPFLGLDLGTGSGIILAAAWLQAKRNGRRGDAAVRRGDGSGNWRPHGRAFYVPGPWKMILADARTRPCMPVYRAGRWPVGNENVPAPTARHTVERPREIHAALFAAGVALLVLRDRLTAQ